MAKCVWPRQIKPMMPIVGMAADGLGFFSSQYAKPSLRKPNLSCLGLVKILEGFVSASELEKDFSFHFPWGRTWKAEKCPAGYVMHFPSQDKLDELSQFIEVKMKMSGAKIMVLPWNCQANAKARLHTVWMSAENVLDELRHYQAICELGSILGAVEEVDLKSLEMSESVKFKVHVKSINMIPKIVEVGVKPFLFDVYFKVDSIVEEGWNEDNSNHGKRVKSNTCVSEGSMSKSTGKKARKESVDGKEKNEVASSAGKGHSRKTATVTESEGQKITHKGDKTLQHNEEDSGGQVNLELSEEDLLSSQELAELAKSVGVNLQCSQESGNENCKAENTGDGVVAQRDKKGKAKMAEGFEGLRRSPRLEADDDLNITEKAINRAEAKDTFIHKGNCWNPFSVLNTKDAVLVDLANSLGVCLGNNKNEIELSLQDIKMLEETKLNVMLNSSGGRQDSSPLVLSEDRDVVSSQPIDDSQNDMGNVSDEDFFLNLEKESALDMVYISGSKKSKGKKHFPFAAKGSSSKRRKKRARLTLNILVSYERHHMELSGFEKKGKYEFIKELTSEEKLDFIGLQKINRKVFNQNWLDGLCGTRSFIWVSAEPNGRSGGLLSGFNSDTFDILSHKCGKFMISSLITHKREEFFVDFFKCIRCCSRSQ
jgi:hypothetical protein